MIEFSETFKQITLVVNSLAVLNLVSIALFLLTRKNNTFPNKILALLIFMPSINFMYNIFAITGIVFDYPNLLLLSTSVLNSLFPLLFYLYILSVIGLNLKKAKNFLPWLVLVIYTIYFQFNYFNLAFENKQNFINLILQGNPPIAFTILNLLFFSATLTYALSGIKIAKKAKKKKTSDINPIENINVLRNNYIFNFNLIALGLTFFIILLYLIIPFQWVEFMVLPISMTIIFFVVVFSAQKSALIFSDEGDTINYKIDTEKEDQRLKQAYPKIDFDGIKNTLNELKKKGIYLNPQLSLNLLSEEIDVPASQISIVIKEKYNQNFSEFVNASRIEYAKQLLINNTTNKYSIEGIALESGFNSRASFYRLFKKVTGITPTEFIASKQAV